MTSVFAPERTRGFFDDSLRGLSGRLLGPYVPTLVVDWLRDRPRERYRSIDCTLVFADISGFTRMTELLGGRGKIGAEEMADIINGTFDRLLRTAYSYAAGLIKWGGDATLLLFEGPAHAQRACRAAYEMQQVMRRTGGLRTSRGSLRLRVSIGIHSGTCEFFLVGHDDHRELLVLGPGATVVTQMEKIAHAGQIVVSDGTVAALAQAGERPPAVVAGTGWLLRHPPHAEPHPPGLETVDYAGVDIGVALCPAVRQCILGGGVEFEHRHAAFGFLRFGGVDQLIAEQGPAAALPAVDYVITALQGAASRNDVALLATDIDADGGKVVLSAGAPRCAGRDEDRMVATLREALDAGGVLPLRAGANSGRAFAGDYGPPYRRTYSVIGDCVNLAARLMAHASDGELLAGEDLVQALAGRFPVSVRPPFAAKGKRAPVTPFRIGSPTRARLAAAPEAMPMIGREDELATLVEAARAAAEGTGRVIEIVGGPGMGKSRLLAEVQARADAAILSTEGDVYATTRPYVPFERLLRAACGLPGDAAEEAVVAGLEAITREHASHLAAWLPLIGIAAGLELPGTPEVEQTDPTLRKQRLEELTSELLGLVLSGATLLIFNDAHLMDDASRDLIRRLAADAPARPWLVLVSRRPDGDSPLGELPLTRLALGPLSDRAAVQLLAAATQSAPLPPQRLLSLAERAAGNPLFLRELAAQLSEGGDPGSLPSSVEDAIAERIDRLVPSDRRTLRAAAVLGMDVEPTLLEEVLGTELGSAAPVEQRLMRLSEFLEPTGPGRRRFSHQLLREVAYEALPYRRRTELHARTAAAIQRIAGPHADEQAELLSLHLFHGQQYAAAWRFSKLAAERARRRYANAEAADAYRRALSAGARVAGLQDSELAEVDGALGEVSVELGEMGDADVAFRRALRRVRDQPATAARLQLRLARLRELCGQHAAALHWATRAEQTLAGLDGPEPRVIRGQLAARRAHITYRRGRHTDAVALAQTAAELARRAGDLRTLAEALEYGDNASVELGLAAGAGAKQALAIYEELGALSDEARVRNTLGVLAYHRGAWPEALKHYEMAESAYTRSGMRWGEAITMANSAEILADQGRLEEAQARLERAMLTWRGVGAASEVAFGEYQLGRIDVRLGRTARAMERLAAAREHFQGCGELTEVAVVDALAAECLSLAGDNLAALSLAERTLARVRALGGVAAATPVLQRVRAAALSALGHRDEAECALRDGLEAARRRGARHEVAFTLAALTELGDESAEAEAWREELSALLGELGIEPARGAARSRGPDRSVEPSALRAGARLAVAAGVVDQDVVRVRVAGTRRPRRDCRL